MTTEQPLQWPSPVRWRELLGQRIICGHPPVLALVVAALYIPVVGPVEQLRSSVGPPFDPLTLVTTTAWLLMVN